MTEGTGRGMMEGAETSTKADASVGPTSPAPAVGVPAPEATTSGKPGPKRLRDSRGVTYLQEGGTLRREGVLMKGGLVGYARSGAPRTKRDRALARAGLPYETKGRRP